MLNSIRKQHEDKLQHHLISQGSFFSNIIKHSTTSFNSLWSSVQSRLPKNIFNFTIKYINNTLLTRKNGEYLPRLNVHSAWSPNHFCMSSLDVKLTYMRDVLHGVMTLSCPQSRLQFNPHSILTFTLTFLAIIIHRCLPGISYDLTC